MEDNTSFITKTDDKLTEPIKKALYCDEGNGTSNNSHIMNVSVRGWLTIVIIATVCFMSLNERKIVEPLYSLALLAAGFYFGSSKTTPSNTVTK